MFRTVIPVVRLEGVISAGRGLSGGALNLAATESALARAFAMREAPCVALALNSPGGSAVQSALIARRIRQLSEMHSKPALVFVEDAAASGGYWIACAGDEIFVDATSIVGSIGVIGAAFGFPEALSRLGIERRVHTAGRRKSQLDPFRPEDPNDLERLERLLAALHREFIDWVQSRRRVRLKQHPDLFEGEIFTGREAVELGLADALGDMNTVLRARFGERVKLKPVARAQPSIVRRLLGAAVEEVAAEIQARALWSRLGV